MLFRFERERMFHTAIERCSWLQAVKNLHKRLTEYEIEKLMYTKVSRQKEIWLDSNGVILD